MNTTWFEAGHVAIVTGGSKGLGKELARELIRKGVTAIIDGRNAETLERTRRELSALGSVVAIAGDVADKAHVHALVAAARRLGRLDLLINNASTLGQAPLPYLDELTEGTFDRIFKVNVFAPIHLMQHALPLMLESGDLATIVNVTSDAAVQAYPGWGGYGASKAALEHVSRVLAAEFDPARVRVLSFDPGDMRTEMHAAAVPDADPDSLADPNDAARSLLEAFAAIREPYSRVSLGSAVPA